jgi:hypothetical protein
MSVLLRLVAVGGWLAYILNQDSDYQPDVTRRKGPGLLLVAMFVGVILTAMAGSQLIVASMGGEPASAPGGVLAWILADVVTGGFTVLLVVGWLVHFVPFVASDQSPADGEYLELDQETRVHVTGTIDANRPAVILRRRSAVVRRDSQGRLALLIDRWHVKRGSSGPAQTLARVFLTASPETVANARRGDVYLVGGPRSAIRFNWRLGPVVLDFDSTTARDCVWAELSGSTAPRATPSAATQRG